MLPRRVEKAQEEAPPPPIAPERVEQEVPQQERIDEEQFPCHMPGRGEDGPGCRKTVIFGGVVLAGVVLVWNAAFGSGERGPKEPKVTRVGGVK